jgi:hypothetical protein
MCALVATFLAACSGDSTRPTTTAPSPIVSPTTVFTLSGAWRVSYRMSGGTSCNTFPLGATAEAVFRFAQVNSNVTGSMFGADVNGIEAQGEVALNGEAILKEFQRWIGRRKTN